MRYCLPSSFKKKCLRKYEKKKVSKTDYCTLTELFPHKCVRLIWRHQSYLKMIASHYQTIMYNNAPKKCILTTFKLCTFKTVIFFRALAPKNKIINWAIETISINQKFNLDYLFKKTREYKSHIICVK